MTRERSKTIHVMSGLWRKGKKQERNQNTGACCYEQRFFIHSDSLKPSFLSSNFVRPTHYHCLCPGVKRIRMVNSFPDQDS